MQEMQATRAEKKSASQNGRYTTLEYASGIQ